MRTRKDWGHLSEDATLDDYHAVIQAVLRDGSAQVFIYHFGDEIYPTIVTEINDMLWLVMFSLGGIMETAFIVERPDEYLTKSQFELLGTLSEVMA